MTMESSVTKTRWHLKSFSLNVPVKHACRSSISRNIDAVRKNGWNLQSIAPAPPARLEGQREDCLLTVHLRLDVFVKHVEQLELNNVLYVYCVLK